MTQERIRILVDLSRDFSWADGLVNIEPDDVYHTSDNSVLPHKELNVVSKFKKRC